MALCKTLVAAIWLLVVLHAGAALAQTEQRIALVVGNAKYLNVVKLKNPENDATAVAATLRGLGFEVIERENVSRRDMIQATRIFAQKLSPGGIGLFFYAGHGIQAQGANYLVPVDANLAVEDDLKYETLDLQDILNKLDEARVRLSIVILDACRDNPFRAFRSSGGGLAMINPPAGTVIAFATAPGKVALDGSGDNGIFTTELLKAMSRPDKLLDVFEHVTDAVQRETGNRQAPWINSSFRGDFYFTGPTTVTIEPPPATSSEVVFWQSIASSTNPADFEAYLQQYPQGSFVALARIRLASLAARPAPTRPSSPVDPKPPEARHPLPAPVPLAKRQPPVVEVTEVPKVVPPPKEAPATGASKAEQPRTPPVQQPVASVPAAGEAPSPSRKLQSSPAEAQASPAPPVVQSPAAQPTQEALVRPPAGSAGQTGAPDAGTPRSAATAPGTIEIPRGARNCQVPHSTGFDTGAGGYATIRVVNTGRRCGTHLVNKYQPTSYVLSLSKPPGHGSVTIEGNAFYYTPAAGYAGGDEFAIVTTPWGSLRVVVTVVAPPS